MDVRTDQQIRLLGLIPQEIEPVPAYPQALNLVGDVQRTLTVLEGTNAEGAQLVHASTDKALRVEAYGVGFHQYIYKSGTAPNAWDVSHQLYSPSHRLQRIDFLILTQYADITFLMGDGTWGDAISLAPGWYSFPFTTTWVKIRKTGATAGTYQMVGYY